MNKEELKKYIETVFDDMPHPNLITLHVAQAHDDWDYDNDLKHRRKDFKGHWKDIPSEHLRGCRDALAHLDAAGLRYYLPAYMIWVLNDFGEHDIDDFVLYTFDNSPKDREMNKYFRARFSLFNKEQLRACALFVKYCAENDPEDLIDVSFAQKKYDRHWHEYI